jgi:hypothetical protein
MDEMIPLGRVKFAESVVSAFVWSQKEGDKIQWWNNDPLALGVSVGSNIPKMVALELLQ